MAGTTQTLRVASDPTRVIRRALCAFAVVLGLTTSVSAQAAQKAFTAHGTTQGALNPNPTWSAGVQLGNYGATGVVAQKVGFYGGALNTGLGLAYGSATLHADYIRLMSENFEIKTLGRASSYNQLRGQYQPFFGGGLQVGRGFSFRLPVGLQYTMLRDPFDFFGGVTVVTPRFFTDERGGFQLWFNLGARLLL